MAKHAFMLVTKLIITTTMPSLSSTLTNCH